MNLFLLLAGVAGVLALCAIGALTRHLWATRAEVRQLQTQMTLVAESEFTAWVTELWRTNRLRTDAYGRWQATILPGDAQADGFMIPLREEREQALQELHAYYQTLPELRTAFTQTKALRDGAGA